MIKGALTQAGPYSFMALRFPLAALILWPLLGWRIPSRHAILPGCLLSLLLGAAFYAQVVGLQYTTPTRSAFITGLSVILVPLLYPVITGKKPGRWPVIGASIALIGMVLITDPGGGGLNRGDWITLICAFAYGLYVIVLEVVSKKHDYEDLIVLQFLPLTVVFIPGAMTESAPIEWGRHLIWGLGVTGPILALTLYLQSRYQRYTTATRAAVIFTGEPLFAAVFSFLLIGETLKLIQWGGGVLILAGILAAIRR